MRVPVWLTLGVAVLVCVFGAYRIRLAFRSDEEDERARARKGLYAMARRTHFLIGTVYLLLGAALVATSFGWSPLGNLFGPGADAPNQSSAPDNVKSIPLDLPAPPPSPTDKGVPAPNAPADNAKPPPQDETGH